MTDLLVDDDMTSLLCLLYCKDKGAKYFATQNGNQCFCGYSDVVSDYTIHGSATCDEDCAGDDSIACGEEEGDLLVAWRGGTDQHQYTKLTCAESTNAAATRTRKAPWREVSSVVGRPLGTVLFHALKTNDDNSPGPLCPPSPTALAPPSLPCLSSLYVAVHRFHSLSLPPTFSVVATTGMERKGGNWALSLYKIDEDVEATTPVRIFCVF
ncbi:unnamed protein product [Hapterophycus canaliculatus]